MGVKANLDRDTIVSAGAAVADARRQAAVGQHRVAVACLEYADLRRELDRSDDPAGRRRSSRAQRGEFVADELAIMLRQQPWSVRCLVARSRRVRGELPTVWEAFGRGEVDVEQVLMIDRIARRATRVDTRIAIDDQAVAAAQTRSPKQLGAFLLRLVIELEPDAFADRHRRALAERRVTVAQGPDGIGYVTGEMTAADAAAVDAVLSVAARDLGAEDPRTEQQRRADIFTDILLGRLRFTDADGGNGEPVDPATAHWLEVEDIDSDTGELLGTHRERVDLDGAATLVPELSPDRPDSSIRFVRRPLSRRVGVVVPLSSLLGLTDTAAELTDRSGAIPGEALRDAITDALGAGDPVLFTRLLTDDGGRLLDSTELGRYASRRLAEAIRVRAGTCRHPTCTVPAGRCDLDHLVPHPQGTTSADNLEPACRRHHRGKTFAWLAAIRDGDTTTWTLPDQTSYRVVDDPLPTGITPGRARGNDRGGGSGRPRRRRRPRRARSRPGSGATSPPCPRRQ